MPPTDFLCKRLKNELLLSNNEITCYGLDTVTVYWAVK